MNGSPELCPRATPAPLRVAATARDADVSTTSPRHRVVRPSCTRCRGGRATTTPDRHVTRPRDAATPHERHLAASKSPPRFIAAFLTYYKSCSSLTVRASAPRALALRTAAPRAALPATSPAPPPCATHNTPPPTPHIVSPAVPRRTSSTDTPDLRPSAARALAPPTSAPRAPQPHSPGPRAAPPRGQHQHQRPGQHPQRQPTTFRHCATREGGRGCEGEGGGTKGRARVRGRVRGEGAR